MGAAALNHVAVGLGTSLGDPAVLGTAVFALARMPHTEVLATSRVYWSAPVGGMATRPFHNGVVRARTALGLDDFLTRLQVLERRLGRRPARSWADRRIDLDVLVWDRRVVVGRRVTVPHPRMTDRAFVLAPLADAWPGCVDPWTGRPYRLLPRARLPVAGVLPGPAR